MKLNKDGSVTIVEDGATINLPQTVVRQIAKLTDTKALQTGWWVVDINTRAPIKYLGTKPQLHLYGWVDGQKGDSCATGNTHVLFWGTF